jgi:hypothetical protein
MGQLQGRRCKHIQRPDLEPDNYSNQTDGQSPRRSVNEERVFVCDERGVQGRLEGRAGTALGAAF